MHPIARPVSVGVASALLILSTLAVGMMRPSEARAAECDVKLSLMGGPQTDGELVVRIWQDFVVWGYGFPADTELTIDFERADASESWQTRTDGDGEFVEAFYFLPGALMPGWNILVHTSDYSCQDHASIYLIDAHPFTDVIGHSFEREIAWLFQVGITGGCAADRYCPNASVTRQQMASFLARAFHLPTASHDYFSDDNGTRHEGDINRVAEAGITKGCAPGKYCPTAVITRGQMASFLARAFDLPTASHDYFSDDNGTTHEGDINRVAEAGITRGCSLTSYCPDAAVTRGQMAAFLFRALY